MRNIQKAVAFQVLEPGPFGVIRRAAGHVAAFPRAKFVIHHIFGLIAHAKAEANRSAFRASIFYVIATVGKKRNRAVTVFHNGRTRNPTAAVQRWCPVARDQFPFVHIHALRQIKHRRKGAWRGGIQGDGDDFTAEVACVVGGADAHGDGGGIQPIGNRPGVFPLSVSDKAVGVGGDGLPIVGRLPGDAAVKAEFDTGRFAIGLFKHT